MKKTSLKKIIPTFLLLALVACISQESVWSGSLDEFTENYVKEVHKMSVMENSDPSSFIGPSQFLNIYIFSISKAEAKTKEKKKSKKKSKKKKPLLLDSPKFKKIQRRQAIRLPKIEYYKIKQIIGEKEDGLLGIRTTASLSKTEKKKMKKVVDDENKDRQTLYTEIIKKNKYDKKMQTVLRNSFFESYQNWAPEGSYFFKNGKWQTKGKYK